MRSDGERGAIMRSPYLWLAILTALGFWTWHAHFRAYPIVNSPPRPGPIIAFGDSLTYGIGARDGESYPAQLARLIGRPIVNRGVPGETAAEADKRLERDVLAAKPSIVLVLLGGNDLLKRNDLDQAFAELEKVVRRIQRGGGMVVLIGIAGLPPLVNMRGRYKTLARAAGCVYVPNILGGIFTKKDLMSDQIHPNAKGYAIMAERIADALKPYLKRAPA